MERMDEILSGGVKIGPTLGLIIVIAYIGYLIWLNRKTNSPIFFLLFFIMWGCGFMGGGLAAMNSSFLFGLIFCVCAIFAPILFMSAGSSMNRKSRYRNNQHNENKEWKQNDIDDDSHDKNDKNNDWIVEG